MTSTLANARWRAMTESSCRTPNLRSRGFTDPGPKNCALLGVYRIFHSRLPAGDSIGQVDLIATRFLTAERGNLNRSVPRVPITEMLWSVLLEQLLGRPDSIDRPETRDASPAPVGGLAFVRGKRVRYFARTPDGALGGIDLLGIAHTGNVNGAVSPTACTP
jgi:hypothetical protein